MVNLLTVKISWHHGTHPCSFCGTKKIHSSHLIQCTDHTSEVTSLSMCFMVCDQCILKANEAFKEYELNLPEWDSSGRIIET